jgi:hypothetical protein
MPVKNYLLIILALYILIGCTKPFCPEHCSNGVRDEDENGIDCGGSCNDNCTLKEITLQPGAEGSNATVSSISPDIGEAVYPGNVMCWTNHGNTMHSEIFLTFDYRNVPSSARIKKATVTLFADTSSNSYPGTDLPKGHSQYSNSNESTLKRITSPWDENLITWNTRPSVDETAIIAIPESSSCSQAYSIDVTTFVQEEFKSKTHYGFCLSLVQQTPYCSLMFYSDDGPYASLKPKIELEYY